MPTQITEATATVVRLVTGYRFGSPQKAEKYYVSRGDRAPVSGRTISRIIEREWIPRSDDEQEVALLQLAGMLKLPPLTFLLMQAGDVEGVRRLEFPEADISVRQLILDAMEPPAHPKRRRNGTHG